MILKEIIQREEKNDLGKSLVQELYKISDDEEFVAGVLLDVQNDNDKRELLDYIISKKNVSFEQIIIKSLYLSKQRDNQQI
ncbi:MAG: hypothetical protein K5756_08825 [Clostridiales bacterium]|nr:hypothetical protein [Clostridiales bacterium]